MRKEAFAILRTFPVLPAQLVPYLWEVALGTSKTERPLAMAALESVPGKTQVLLDALRDARQEARLAAAEWVGKFHLTAAIPTLQPCAEKREERSRESGHVQRACDSWASRCTR